MRPAHTAAQRVRPVPMKHQAKGKKFRPVGKNVPRAWSRAAQGPPLPSPRSVPSYRMMRDWRKTESGTLIAGMTSTQRKGQNQFRIDIVLFLRHELCRTHVRALLF